MPDPIYFQWQNKFLLKTIYPLRDTKLRDFLVFFFEVEIWEKYKDKTPADIPGDIQKYCDALKKKVDESFDVYERLRAYFLSEDIASAYHPPLFPQTDPEILARITTLHKTFITFFPKYTKPAHIKYFISERAREFEELRKKVYAEITRNKRLVNNPSTIPAKKADAERKLQLLSTISTGMLNKELGSLFEMLAAYERITRFQQDLDKRKAEKEKARQDAAAGLKDTRVQLDPLIAQLNELHTATERLAHPPSYPTLRAYFLQPDASANYRDFATPDRAVLERIQALHKDFSTFYPKLKSAAEEKNFINKYVQIFETMRDQKQKELAGKQRAAGWLDLSTPGGTANEAAIQALQKTSLPMVLRELNKLYDLRVSHERQSQPTQNFSTQITQNQAAITGLEAKLAALRKTEAETLARINQIEQELKIPLREQLRALVTPQRVTVKDVVRWQTDIYIRRLQELVEKNKSAELLERVVREFVTRPERYPLWLQYMVIHFSGMRYQSAHGSWANPKDLVSSLRHVDVENELKPLKEDEIAALCEEKYLCYQAARSGSKVLGDGSEAEHNIPALARAPEPKWREKVDRHLKTLAPNSYYHKRGALQDARIDEEDYEIERYTDQQALDALVDLKTELPEWMWNEIVRVTNLRLKEVGDENWEQVSNDDMLARYAHEMGMYRDILNDWKRANATAWREEHDRTSDLIVSRAVCNEVAEHIQHVRGNSPPGGLTAKPEWYLRLEKNSRAIPAEKRSIFMKAKTTSDFKPGASLFWLRWVNKEPNQWQIARPFSMNNGEDIVLVGPNSDGTNTILSTGDMYKRTVKQKVNGGETTSVQWLRWMHEATVAKVAETVDGPTVLTFETATPIDDKRQATIGVFKHMAGSLYYQISPSIMNGTFVGYTPEGDVPFDHIREMLDWNHILRREAFTAEEIEAYWQKMETPVEVSFAGPEWIEEVDVEVAPLLLPGRWTAAACGELAADGQSMVPYQPRVALRRGVRLTVNKTGRVEFDGQAYYPITRCDHEPRAQDLYIPCDEVIDLPEKSSLLVTTREGLELHRISGIGLSKKPLFEPAGAHLDAGTRLLLSTVQRIGPDSPGGGLVVGQRRRRYYLIHACPEVREVEGLFILASKVKKIRQLAAHF